MKRFFIPLWAGAGAWLGLVSPVFAADQVRQQISMDAGWKFSRGDFGGAERPAFDDSSWRALDVPHDWSIEGPFDRMTPAGGAGAFLPTGLGWYRKHFTPPAYASGSLKAVASNQGQVVASDELRTAGHAAKIVLESDHPVLAPAYDAVATVTATVVDAEGVIVPQANDQISFQIAGPGVIAAVDSGDHNSHEPYQAAQRLAYEGRCFALIKASAASGQITLTASAPALGGATVVIAASAP